MFLAGEEKKLLPLNIKDHQMLSRPEAPGRHGNVWCVVKPKKSSMVQVCSGGFWRTRHKVSSSNMKVNLLHVGLPDQH